MEVPQWNHGDLRQIYWWESVFKQKWNEIEN
jgi:hypothetical protein